MSFILTGVVVGVLSGFLGVGGGVFVVPALTMLFGFGQRQAVGTSMGMLLPPIGILAFLTYWRNGDVDLGAAGLLAAGFTAGAFAGSLLVTGGWVPESVLRQVFAFFLLYMAAAMLFRSDTTAWAAVKTVALMAGYAVAYLAARAVGRRLERPRPSAAEIHRRASAERPLDYDI